MRRKPDGCRGCPLDRDGWLFVPDKIDPEAETLVVSMFPSTYEARTGVARSGMVISEYENKYERYAGPIHKSYSHVVRCRGQRGTALPKGKVLKDGAAFCRKYDEIPEATTLIVYNGVQVGKLLRPDMGVTKIQKWRGFIYPDKETEEN
jgi:hypothetical protein